MSGKLDREIKMFLVAGFSAVATDMSVYYLLYGFLDHSPAKAISFISGSLVAYILNKFFTFEQKEKSYSEMVRFAMLYLTTLGVNVAVNKVSLILFSGFVFVAFLLATVTSTVLNFLGQKFWVFKEQAP
jgi:putative flippase GtrA